MKTQKNCLELKHKIYLFHTDNGDLQSRIRFNHSTNRNNTFYNEFRSGELIFAQLLKVIEGQKRKL